MKINSDFRKIKLLSNPKGFTLVELIVVIAVIGIISTIGISSFTNYLKIARDAVKIDEASRVLEALSAYMALYGTMPRDTGGTRVGIGKTCGTTQCATCVGETEFSNEMLILTNSGFLDKPPASNFCWFDYSGSVPPYVRVWANLEINPNLGNTGISWMNWATNLTY